MSAGERFKSWVEVVAGSWKIPVRAFLSDALSIGFDAFFKVLGNSFAPKLAPLIQRIEATGEVPDELKPFLAEMKAPTGEVGALISSSATNALVGGAVGKILDAAFLPLAYAANWVTRNVLLDPNALLTAEVRGLIDNAYSHDNLRRLGYDDNDINTLRQLRELLYNPDQAINLWRRGKITEAECNTELKKLGLTNDKIEGAKALATILPSASDIIRFAVREVYSPEIAEKFGQFADFPEKAITDAAKIGFDRDLLSKYWASHWDLPSAGQGFEMLHRSIISHDDLSVLLRALDVMPYWRDKLIQVAYNPYTRVDARRMWDMGVLNDIELTRSYKDIGYDDEHAKNMVLWTKVFVTFPDLIARYKNSYINLDDVKTELLKLGMPGSRANWLIETKIKPESPARTAKERDLTKAEIIKGLYKGVIDEPTAVELLTDMGYDENEAKFIIVINMPKEETKAVQTQKQLTKTDVINGLKSGILTETDAIAKLVAIKYVPDDAAYLVQIALATIKPPAEAKQRELTKADIVKGVKVGLITAEEGYLMLQDIGYTADSAAFILMISTAAAAGSPDSFSDFKAITQAYRQASGLTVKPISIELQQAERNLIAVKAALDYGRQHKVADTELVKLEKSVSDATLAYSQLLAKYQAKEK